MAISKKTFSVLVRLVLLQSFIFGAYTSLLANSIQSILKPKQNDSELLVQLTPVLEYLNTCESGKFDWTTSLPIAPPPPKVRKALVKSYLQDILHTYYNQEINTELSAEIVKCFNRKFIDCSANNIKIRYTAFDILREFYAAVNISKDDVLLIIAPTFGYYIQQATEQNIKIKLVFAKKENGWKITPEDLEEALQSSHAKLLLFTNPVNPTGVLYTQEEVERLASVIKKHNVFTISDEIFADLYFDPAQKPYSLAAVSGMRERTLTLSGVGKTKGLRLSFACIDMPHMPALPISGVIRPMQVGAGEALKDTKENKAYWVRTMAEYRSKVKYIQSLMKHMNLQLNQFYKTTDIVYVQTFIEPVATNIFLLSFSGVLGKKLGQMEINNSLDLAKYIYKNVGVAMVPGEGFFIDGREMVLRIPMSITQDELRQGFHKILIALTGRRDNITPPSPQSL